MGKFRETNIWLKKRIGEFLLEMHQCVREIYCFYLQRLVCRNIIREVCKLMPHHTEKLGGGQDGQGMWHSRTGLQIQTWPSVCTVNGIYEKQPLVEERIKTDLNERA